MANCLTKAVVLVGVVVLVGLMQLPTLLFADEHCWEFELLAKPKKWILCQAKHYGYIIVQLDD